MTAEPEMRAAQTQSLLHAVHRLGTQEKVEILSQIGASDVARIDEMLPLAFLPMELHMHVSDCVRDVIGSERNVAIWREAMVTAFNRPFLKSFVALTIGIFGVTPGGLLRRSDRVHGHVTRNLGELSFRFDPRSTRGGYVTLTGFPATRFRFVCYVEGLAGCLEATFDVCRTQGTVQVEESDPRGNVTYRVAWG